MKYNHISKLIRSFVTGCCLLMGTQLSHAVSYRVNVDTSTLAADPTGPFALDFQITGGDPLANSITVSNFNFGGGSATNAPAATIFGGVTGDLNSTVTLTTSQFFNEFFQGFTAGSTLSFDIEFVSNVNLPTPDAFSFSILDGSLSNILTDGLGNSLFLIEFDSISPTPQAFTAENGVSVSFGPVPPAPSSVPDNGTTIGLLGLALLGMAAVHGSSRIRRIFAA